MKTERDLIESGVQDTVIGCHCYQYNGDFYAFYEDQRIRYTTAANPDTNGIPVSVDWWTWKSDLPRVKCKECPFYEKCEYMDSAAF